MIRKAPLKYVATFHVEADSREVLEAAVEYVMRCLEGGLVGYAYGPQTCVCKVEVEWRGDWLTIKTCTERTAYAVAKLLVMAYTWLGGKAIQVIRHEEQTP